jgi:hypothetical protein
MNDEPYDQIISLGYRCSSAGILKSLGLKTESYPFDWMVSRLPIIENCIQTGFKYAFHPEHYTSITGVTNHYTSIDPSSQQWICNEFFCFNTYYEESEISNIQYYLPRPIHPSRDAYGYKFMMNHRNITTNPYDRDYYSRCVERFNAPYKKRLALYIHPAIFYEEFIPSKPEYIGELRRAHKSVSTAHPHDGIYIIPVKTPFEYPTQHCCKYVLEEHPDDEMHPKCRICILWTNRDFIDAGEIFMGNCGAETYVIKEYVQHIVNRRGIAVL